MICFRGRTEKHSICAWIIQRGRPKTEGVLLQINVACDSCCALCNCTWETAIHLMTQYHYSREVWKSLLAKLNLEPTRCTNPLELLASVTLPLDQQAKGLQTPSKLLFNAFIWRIWAERMVGSSEVMSTRVRLCYRKLFTLFAAGFFILT